jgi:hypothetical protein
VGKISFNFMNVTTIPGGDRRRREDNIKESFK